MTILDKINAYKKLEVASNKKAFPISLLEKSPFYESESASLVKSIKSHKIGIIAEHKRKSPSKSVINDSILLPQVIKGYETAGATAISVLTDTKFFGGSLQDLLLARAHTSIPILRKEFIIDSYQIVEAKANGADAILLIAASLSKEEIKAFSSLAKQLNLEVLVEIHNEDELDKSLHPTVDIIGVNNRNLKTFEVSIENSIQLSEKIPSDFVKISESGISGPKSVRKLINHDFEGFLIGEHFMKTENPGMALKTFISQLS